MPPLSPAQVALHKPQSSSGLGIRLEQQSVRTRGGHTRAVVVGALLPGAFSQSSGALRAGGRVAITPTPTPNPNLWLSRRASSKPRRAHSRSRPASPSGLPSRSRGSGAERRACEARLEGGRAPPASPPSFRTGRAPADRPTDRPTSARQRNLVERGVLAYMRGTTPMLVRL